MYQRGIINILFIIIGLVFVLILLGYFTTPSVPVVKPLPDCASTTVGCGNLSH